MPTKPLPLPEFIILTAMIMASVAFSIDSMLPAMTAIAEELTPDAPNRAQLIITSFVLGMGVGTLFTGPLSDRFGRKPVVLFGFVLYFFGAFLSWAAPTLELVLLARVFQGIGAAGPRIAILAIVRDQFEGRRMAQVMSFAMMVFTLVPAVAPLMGSFIIDAIGWRGIFLAYMAWAVAILVWVAVRQGETLHPEDRRPFRLNTIVRGSIEILSIRAVTVTIAILALVFGVLFGTLSTVQPIFAQTFGAEESFPKWFGGISLISAGASFLNARIVVQIGMRAVIRWTLWTELAISTLIAVIALTGAFEGTAYFILFLIWIQSIFFMAGLCIGNLNALAMEPLGHLAGLGASLISAIATVAAVAVAAPIGLSFDGTPISLAVGTALCCAGSLALMQLLGPSTHTAPTTDPAA
ncbi:MFS transporter [Pseudoruegeria sp. HB172150]|uniref:MFS transporter n=1 Tax=Pseudoruegeria sp. HB172150 TaxID=2721164 RepID=UPI001554C700|nr:MFS transporter [Pseudoruegeria sp. HB172150]